MKKISDFKLKIRDKILILVLGSSIISLLMFFFISQYGLKQEGGKSVAVIDELSQKASSENEANIKSQAKKYLQTLVETQAESSDFTFKIIESQAAIAHDYAEELWKNPNKFTVSDYAKLEGTKMNEELAFYYGLATKVSEANVAGELKLLSNLGYVFRSVLKNNLDMKILPMSIDGIYLGTETGIFYNMSTEPYMDKGYDARLRPWYIQAKNTKLPGWTDLYEDVAIKDYTITYVSPCYDKNNKLKGVIGLDMTLNAMLEIITTQLKDLGYVAMVDKSGKIITYSLLDEKGKKFVGESKIITESQNSGLRDISGRILKGEEGITEIDYNGEKRLVGYAPIKTMGWSIVLFASTDELMGYVKKSKEKMEQTKDVLGRFSEKSLRDTMNILLGFFVVIVLLMIVISYKFSFLITNPLAGLVNKVEEVGKGNLEIDIDIKTGDEVEMLAESFQKMTIDLKTFIRNLQETTAAKQKIESELHVATAIQASMLPRIFPPFPNRKEIDIFAIMEPAKEVGGDLYDFFLIDEKKLCLVIGDVSGKGVPASLFMVITKTLIKNEALRGISVEDIFNNVNRMLSEQNDECMFVTTFVGIIDLDTGELEFSNAGHNPPLINRKGTKEFEYMTLPKGFVLAGMPGMKFKKDKLTLEAGDTLYMYTDGVTEAMDKDSHLYSDARLASSLSAIKDEDRDVNKIVKIIREDMREHVKEAEQSDDITMLVIKYKGKVV